MKKLAFLTMFLLAVCFAQTAKADYTGLELQNGYPDPIDPSKIYGFTFDFRHVTSIGEAETLYGITLSGFAVATDPQSGLNYLRMTGDTAVIAFNQPVNLSILPMLMPAGTGDRTQDKLIIDIEAPGKFPMMSPYYWTSYIGGTGQPLWGTGYYSTPGVTTPEHTLFDVTQITFMSAYPNSDATLSAWGLGLYGPFRPASVPVPGAIWLLGSGLAGLVAMRRSRKA